MKDKKILIKREEWDYLRSYRRAPIYKKYLEKVRIREKIDKNKRQYESIDQNIRYFFFLVYYRYLPRNRQWRFKVVTRRFKFAPPISLNRIYVEPNNSIKF